MIPPFLSDADIYDAEEVLAMFLNNDYSEDQQSHQGKHLK